MCGVMSVEDAGVEKLGLGPRTMRMPACMLAQMITKYRFKYRKPPILATVFTGAFITGHIKYFQVEMDEEVSRRAAGTSLSSLAAMRTAFSTGVISIWVRVRTIRFVVKKTGWT